MIRLLSKAFLLIGLAASCGLVESRRAQPQSAIVADACGKSIACAILEDNWPKNKTFHCGSEQVTPAAFATITQTLTVGKVSKTQVESLASYASGQCGNIGSDYTTHSYFHGQITAHYAIKAACLCTGTTPDCVGASTHNSAACNVAYFRFCSLEKDGTACSF